MRTVAAVASVTAVVVVLGISLRAQEAPNTITVNDPRPLAAAILALEKRHGWIVTYEDPPYEYATEVRDVTGAVRRDFDLSKTVLIPGGGLFVFTDPAGIAPGDVDARAALGTMLDAYHTSGNPGTFRVIRQQSVFHVVPTSSLDAHGVATRRTSPLDARIQVRAGDASAFETLQAVLRLAGDASGTQLVVGTVPTNLLRQTVVPQPAANVTARDALLRTFAATRQRLSWQLFCQPRTVTCALNVHVVAMPEG
jgi:hypothetical protein